MLSFFLIAAFTYGGFPQDIVKNRQAIQSCELIVSAKSTDIDYECHFWLSGDSLRLDLVRENKRQVVSRQNGVYTYWFDDPSTEQLVAIHVDRDEQNILKRFLADPRLIGLFANSLSRYSGYSFGVLDSVFNDVQSVSRADWKGESCKVVEYLYPTKSKGRYFFSDVHGQPVRIVQEGKDRLTTADITYGQFAGVWFPTKVIYKKADEGRDVFLDETATVNVIHINGDVPPETFAIKSMNVDPGLAIVGNAAPRLPNDVTPVWTGDGIAPLGEDHPVVPRPSARFVTTLRWGAVALLVLACIFAFRAGRTK